MALFYPVIPIALFFMNVYEELCTLILGSGGLAWQQNNPGKVFFLKPESFFASFFWQMYLTQSLYVFNFLMLGTKDIAVKHTLHDHVLNKEFWRKHLTNTGSYVAPELANWDGKSKTKFSDDTTHKAKAIIKVNDSYLGLGDQVMDNFELGTKEGKAKMENIFQKEYPG